MNKRVNGFTLSEVLITLAVIGVVAAMTIPTVINKYQEQATVSKVKKIYSTMNQAFMLSVKDNGYANEWNVGNNRSATTAKQFTSYFKPYLKVAKDCGTGSGCLGYKEKIKLLNGNKHSVNYDTDNGYYKMILADGSYIVIRAVNTIYCTGSGEGIANQCGVIYCDINGGKSPNTVGKDIFEFIVSINGVFPAIGDTCNTSSNGWGCSGYILKNNNMDYLK